MSKFLLLHSPLVGPSTWQPVANVLSGRGVDVVVPDLRASIYTPAPHWQLWSTIAAGYVAPEDAEVTLVGHSGAGRILPLVSQAIGRPPSAYIFVDAGLPYNDESHLTRAPESFRDLLRAVEGPDGYLRPWTDWWGPGLLEGIVPDPAMRAVISADCPSVPARMLDEPIPVPSSWPDARCAFVSFTYEEEAREAERRGWPVRRVGGSHLHLVVEPVVVAEVILELTR